MSAQPPQPPNGLRPATVWMIHLRTGRDGLKGELALEGATLVFRPETKRTGETEIPIGQIKRARRVRGTPVLEVQLRTPNRLAVEVIGFYFTKPPSLADPPDVRFFKRRVARRRALTDLRRANLVKKEQIAVWARAIGEAKGPG